MLRGTVYDGDTLTLTQTGSFASQNVGWDIAVTASDSLGGSSAGNYILTQPSHLSANITVNPFVAWTGGASGNWSNASNWAGGAIPDFSNVAVVSIPSGVTVTYDSGVAGTTTLNALNSKGNLNIAAGSLFTTGNLSTAGFNQTGGTLNVGGNLQIASTTGGVTLGNIVTNTLNIISQGGAITQIASTSVVVAGVANLIADNGGNASRDIQYNITLANAGNDFESPVTAIGNAITLNDINTLTVNLDSTGAALLTAGGALNISGSVGTSLTTNTTGFKSATTFDKTTIGTSLQVISTGAVTKSKPSTILTVDGAGTTTPNLHVTVNGIEGALIK
jgi:hypothetical protein